MFLFFESIVYLVVLKASHNSCIIDMVLKNALWQHFNILMKKRKSVCSMVLMIIKKWHIF